MTTSAPSTSLQWREDVLPGFQQAALGEATLVRSTSRPPAPRGVVLHVHGYNDYFFHSHVANRLLDDGFVSYAVDLRRAGRSLREGDIPHFMTDVAEPGEDVAAAAAMVADLEPGLPIAVHAHSTGALTTLVRLHTHGPGPVAALALNSPYLGSVPSWRLRLGNRALPGIARRRPLSIVSSGPSWYATHLLASEGGRWEYDTRWKRPDGLPVRAAWLAAVVRAQRQVARGLHLEIPVLAARAGAGGPDSPDNPLLDAQDTIVDVEAISRLAPRLGRDTELLVVPDAVHDLALSDTTPRERYLSELSAWLDRALPPAERPGA
ncbi:alpha/beta hydrolase [Demequina zhanjiangensis]|uniref:Alpha/beta hydrolase n=1 Tax=Demequina zhanjiangensis TaxID=3051659 RepID=A0ABT8G232_9MICO|nr:alpha/beta hydrolase [Demequina sp. SYSU T00b26]MDN4473192.1 alpha/beta hydrolase [Demequina sp. SYSU T00b26]